MLVLGVGMEFGLGMRDARVAKAPIALRALPQKVGEGCGAATSLNNLREVFGSGLPQLVGEVPKGRWGPLVLGLYLGLSTLSLLGPALAAETKLSGAEIILALSDVKLTAQDDGKSISQIFQKAGVTLYVVDGQQSQGFWRVEADKYCSQWPPHEQWDCYDMTRNGKTIAFISSTGKRYEMLLPGAENQ
jgi:hypothetical protein